MYAHHKGRVAMRISEFHIKKLFGLFDHTIAFKTGERITIIHGPNGVGKTTILKLLMALFSQQTNTIRQTPFKAITIIFDDNSRLLVERKVRKGGDSILIFRYGDGIEYTLSPNADDFRRRGDFPLGIIDDMIDNLRRIGPETWLDEINGEKISLEEVLNRYGEYLPWRGPRPPIPDSLARILDSIPVYIIQTQRLLATATPKRHTPHRRPEQFTRATVEDLSQDMAARMQEVLKQSGALAASLDRTFPHRLLQGKLPRTATEKNIREKYEGQTAYRQRLMAAGLLDAEETLPLQQNKLDESERKVLWYYLEDVKRKLDIYSTLLQCHRQSGTGPKLAA